MIKLTVKLVVLTAMLVTLASIASLSVGWKWRDRPPTASPSHVHAVTNVYPTGWTWE